MNTPTPLNPGPTSTDSGKSKSPANTTAKQTKLANTVQSYGFLVLYLVLLSAMGSFVNDMYSPSLPAMRRFFGCSVPTVQLGLTMGMVGLAIGQIVFGPLSDRYGRKPVLFASMSLFVVAAVVSVFSPTIYFFLVCRMFQGAGAAGGYFLARTVPADIYGGRDLAKLMAIVGAINGIAPASAPVLGGIIADAWGWKGVFVVLACYAVLLIALSSFLKESLPKDRRPTGSWLKEFGRYPAMLRNRKFMIHVCLKGAALGILFAYVSATPFIIQEHYGFSQTGYGLLIGFNALFIAAGSMAALRFKLLKGAVRFGCLGLAVSMAATALALWFVHSLVLFEVTVIPGMFCMGMIFTGANTLAMNEGRQFVGESSAILGVTGYIFGGIASPLVGIGNVMHSTAIVFVALTVIVLAISQVSHKLPPDADMVQKQ